MFPKLLKTIAIINVTILIVAIMSLLSPINQHFDFVSSANAQAEEAETEHLAAKDLAGSPEEAAEHGEEHAGGHGAFSLTFLFIALILLVAKVSGLVEKFGQPAVLGELVIGVILGNLVLLGFDFFEPIRSNEIIKFLAELGVVILLFQIGLESNIREMQKVGLKAAIVAVIGVVLPFVLGTYLVGPYLLPGLEQNAYLFLGATLTATSVGITARVFKDLGKLNIPEAKIVLGAAVIDDVLGLIILAVVSALVTIGAVSFGAISWIIAKAILFLVGAIVLGQLLAPTLGKFFSKIHTGIGMKFTLAIVVALIFAYLAGLIELAPIVGAFAAGLVLDPVHFKYFKDSSVVSDFKKYFEKAPKERQLGMEKILQKHADRHIEDIIEPIGLFLIPIFFVTTGFAVNLQTLADTTILFTALAITLVAIIGKVAAGFVAGKGVHKALVGWGMVPRGEVGLIFATIGHGLGVINESVFSIIVIMVILTTLISPPMLGFYLKRI